MAKKSSVEKNDRRRALTKKYAARRAALKAKAVDRSASLEDRMKATMKLATLPKNSAKERIRNRCELTGRSRGVYRKFKLSRICLRDLASRGQIPGMTKSSW